MNNRLILLCVETNKNADTDYKYIREVIRKLYKNEVKNTYKPIYMGSKGRYKDKGVISDIEKNIREYKQVNRKINTEIIVIYFIDTDDCNADAVRKKEFDTIEKYCLNNGYKLAYFCHDVEDVFWGMKVEDKQKVKKANEFVAKNKIKDVDINNLNCNVFKRHKSNIMLILDNYWVRKK